MVVEGVKDWNALARWLNDDNESISRLYDCSEDAVKDFFKGQCHPCWRTVIFALDGAGETRLANHIRSYGEPVQGTHMYMHTLDTHSHSLSHTHVYIMHAHTHVVCTFKHLTIAINFYRCS